MWFIGGSREERVDGPASSSGGGSEPSGKPEDGPLMLIYDVQRQSPGGEVGQMVHRSGDESTAYNQAFISRRCMK